MRSLDPTEDFAIQLVRRFLVLCEHPRTSERMLRLVERSPRAGAEAPRLLRWLNRALLMGRMRRGTRPMSAMKWELVASQLLSLATARYLVGIEPLASATIDDVVTMAAPGVLGVLQGADGLFTALVVDDQEDLSDLGDLDGFDEVEAELVMAEVPLRGRSLPAGGAAMRRAQHGSGRSR